MSKTITVVLKNSFGLALFGLLTAGLIALTYWNTSSKIEENIEIAESKAVIALIPKSLRVQFDPTAAINIRDIDGLVELSLLGLGAKDAKLYPIYQDNQIAGFVFPTIAPDGYTGPIDLLVSIDRRGSLFGIEVIQHQETPGLGDKIESKKSSWSDQFNEVSLQTIKPNEWKVVKDGGMFDQLTGATITPRAVVKSIKNALLFFEKNRLTLMNWFDKNTPSTSREEQAQ